MIAYSNPLKKKKEQYPFLCTLPSLMYQVNDFKKYIQIYWSVWAYLCCNTNPKWWVVHSPLQNYQTEELFDKTFLMLLRKCSWTITHVTQIMKKYFWSTPGNKQTAPKNVSKETKNMLQNGILSLNTTTRLNLQ